MSATADMLRAWLDAFRAGQPVGPVPVPIADEDDHEVWDLLAEICTEAPPELLVEMEELDGTIIPWPGPEWDGSDGGDDGGGQPIEDEAAPLAASGCAEPATGPPQRERGAWPGASSRSSESLGCTQNKLLTRPAQWARLP